MGMIIDFVNSLNNHVCKLRVSSKNILLKADFDFEARQDGESVFFNGHGSLRMGHKTSSCLIVSNYSLLGTQLVLESHQIIAEGFGFFENYHRKKDQILFKKNNEKLVTVKCEELVFYDPLCILFYLSSLDTTSSGTQEGELLLGGKFKAFHFSKEGANIEFKVAEKLIFSGQRKASETHIVAKWMGLKLKITQGD